jgi:hypothetical protein
MFRGKRTRRGGEVKDTEREESVKETSIVMTRTKKFTARCCDTSLQQGLGCYCKALLNNLGNPSLGSRLISL